MPREPFTPEQRKALWDMIARYPSGSTYGEKDLARYEATAAALEAELAALRKERDALRGALAGIIDAIDNPECNQGMIAAAQAGFRWTEDYIGASEDAFATARAVLKQATQGGSDDGE